MSWSVMGPGVFKMEDIRETLETSHRASHLLSYWAHKNTEDCRDLIYHDILSPSVLLWRVPGQRRDANKKVTKNECSHSRDPVRRPHHSLTQHPLITSTFNGHPHTRSSPGPQSRLLQISRRLSPPQLCAKDIFLRTPLQLCTGARFINV